MSFNKPIIGTNVVFFLSGKNWARVLLEPFDMTYAAVAGYIWDGCPLTPVTPGYIWEGDVGDEQLMKM